MKATTFNNALVTVVGAYAEALAEAQAHIDQLEAALRTASSAKAKARDAWEQDVLVSAHALAARPDSDRLAGDLIAAVKAKP